MSDEANDLSNEQVHEMHHHAEGGAGWIKFAALTAAILATLAAISGSMASKRLTESSRAQIQSNNQWSYYQSKSIKHHMAGLKVDILNRLDEIEMIAKGPSGPGSHSPTLSSEVAEKEKIAKYEKQMEEIKAKAEGLEQESEHFLHAHEILEHGETFFHVAIATIAICLLTKRRLFFVLSLALCGVGIYFFIHGIILHIG